MPSSVQNIRIEVLVNGERKVIAGVESFGVLTAILQWVRRDPAALPLGEGAPSLEEWIENKALLTVGGMNARERLRCWTLICKRETKSRCAYLHRDNSTRQWRPNGDVTQRRSEPVHVIRCLTSNSLPSAHTSTHGSESSNVQTSSPRSILSAQSPSGHGKCQPPRTACAVMDRP